MKEVSSFPGFITDWENSYLKTEMNDILKTYFCGW